MSARGTENSCEKLGGVFAAGLTYHPIPVFPFSHPFRRHSTATAMVCFVFYYFFSSMDSITIRFTGASTCQAHDRLACPSHLCRACGGSEQQAVCFGAGLGCSGFCHSAHFDTAPCLPQACVSIPSG